MKKIIRKSLSIILISSLILTQSCEEENLDFNEVTEQYLGAWQGKDSCRNSLYDIIITQGENSNEVIISNLSDYYKALPIKGYLKNNSIDIPKQTFGDGTILNGICKINNDSITIGYSYNIPNNYGNEVYGCSFKGGKQ